MSDQTSVSSPAPAADSHPSPLATWPPRWQPDAVVFDCDGLLIDTEAVWVGVQDEYLAERGHVLSAEQRQAITGRAAHVVVGLLAEVTGDDPHTIADSLMARLSAMPRDAFQVLPGAVETVRAAAAKVPVAIASNSPRHSLEEKLRGMGLADVVDAMIAVEDVENPKPAPDMYLAGARRLGADPANCLAFEDSETGAQAATAAGLHLIAVPSLPGQNPEAPRRLDSLADPSLAAWIDSWESRRPQ